MNKVVVEDLVKAYSGRGQGQKVLDEDGPFYEEESLVLNQVRFAVGAGSLTCILGPSGCGKSTLLRIMAGFERATSGRVLVDGRPVNGAKTKQVFVFQEDGLFPWMTAQQNVALGIRHMQYTGQRDREVSEYLEMVGLRGFEGHYPHQLSGGMRRRAEVARALITNPEVLFMDEPFAALDFVTRVQMREEMVNVHAMFDTTILFVTHDIDEALQLGDQIVVLSGRPALVKADIPLAFPHPRCIATGELAELRRRVYFLLGLHAAL